MRRGRGELLRGLHLLIDWVGLSGGEGVGGLERGGKDEGVLWRRGEGRGLWFGVVSRLRRIVLWAICMKCVGTRYFSQLLTV